MNVKLKALWVTNDRLVLMLYKPVQYDLLSSKELKRTLYIQCCFKLQSQWLCFRVPLIPPHRLLSPLYQCCLCLWLNVLDRASQSWSSDTDGCENHNKSVDRLSPKAAILSSFAHVVSKHLMFFLHGTHQKTLFVLIWLRMIFCQAGLCTVKLTMPITLICLMCLMDPGEPVPCVFHECFQFWSKTLPQFFIKIQKRWNFLFTSVRCFCSEQDRSSYSICTCCCYSR